MDSQGTLYGTTAWGGTHGNTPGTLFALGKTFSVLHDFCASKDCQDGARPEVRLILDKSERLPGTTNGGGSKGWGTVFRVTP